jgi:agmatinase
MRRIAEDMALPVLSIGVRALSAAEARFIGERGVGLVPGSLLREWPRLLPPLLRRLPRAVYLTIDMDFFDPSVVPGVGTPEPGGALPAARKEAERSGGGADTPGRPRKSGLGKAAGSD